MKKCLMMTVIMVASLIGLNACCTVVPGRIVYSDSLEGTIEDVGAKAALLVTADGNILIYNEKGDRAGISNCKIPEPDQTPVDQKDIEKAYPTDVCRGLTKGSAITNIQTISILKSNSKNCVYFGQDQNGDPIERCW
jgi:hypothetical protein